MDNSSVPLLLDRYLSGACSEEEQLQIEEWLHRQDMPDNEWTKMDTPAKAAWMAALYRDIQHTIGADVAGRQEMTSIPLYRRWVFRAAAAIILLLGIGTYLWKHNPPASDNLAQNKSHDALPGRDGAILSLADGRKLVLDSLGNGIIATQGKTTVQIKNGRLVYDAAGPSGEILYNTMTTPRGRQYRLVLPDGSEVWLNAASSITYPIAFAGNERKVSITGEAYFEVAKDKAKPFHVQTSDMEVEVLGTHFNINAYHDEGTIKTTLLEGSVKVKNARAAVMLRPGQQAAVSTGADAGNTTAVPAQTANIQVVNDADIDEVMAWKNGYFKFNNTDIRTVMQQIGRWYDLQVIYEGAIPKDRFGGKLPRDANASEVLKTLEQTQVHFRIEGNKLIVMP